MSKIYIITGHYGSGKTEVSVNLAFKLREEGKKVALGDLDIVNPYFRSRERAELLEEKGIKVVSSTLGHNSSLDLPAVSSEIRGPMAESATSVILDLGGDMAGARAVTLFLDDIKKQDHEVYLVINAYRPETMDVEGVLKHKEQIEYATKLKITGLISNTHMVWDTTEEDILKGLELTRKVSEETSLPVVMVTGFNKELEKIKENIGSIPTLDIGMYMRDAWM